MTATATAVNIWQTMVNETRGRLLSALRERGDYLSGQMLASSLGTSRVSIWKHIRALKNEGYAIESSPRGYRLVSSPDLLLPYEFPGLEHRIHYFPEVDSTMDVARELAKQGADEGTVVIAESQSHGRGRLSRKWLSPRGGIYVTLILRPRISPAYAPRMNLMAGVAVASTIRRLFGLEAQLKWPNDVLVAGRKVCGILAEMDAEMDVVNYVNLGIGINANAPIPRFADTATSLKDVLGREIPRAELLSALLPEIEHWQLHLMETALLEEWKRLSVTLGGHVKIVMPGGVIVGRAIDVDATGALIVRDDNGCLRKAMAGDCMHLRSRRG